MRDKQKVPKSRRYWDETSACQAHHIHDVQKSGTQAFVAQVGQRTSSCKEAECWPQRRILWTATAKYHK